MKLIIVDIPVTGTLKQHEILVYHKICKEVSDELWDGREARSLRDSDSLYERQFSWELNILHNHTLSPTLEQYRKKQDLIQGYGTLFGCVIACSLKSTLEKATNGTLHTFGSCENGLWWDSIFCMYKYQQGAWQRRRHVSGNP